MSIHGGVIVAATDFSNNSEPALAWAAEFADAVSAALTIVHVVHDPADAPGYYHREDKDLLLPMEDIANRRFGEFLEEFVLAHPKSAALKKAERVVVRGLPANRILSVADAASAAHVVVGSQGRSGLPHIMIGSVALRVVQLSPIPVTVVKSSEAASRLTSD